jgi:hypothetical protein
MIRSALAHSGSATRRRRFFSRSIEQPSRPRHRHRIHGESSARRTNGQRRLESCTWDDAIDGERDERRRRSTVDVRQSFCSVCRPRRSTTRARFEQPAIDTFNRP